MEFQVMVNVIYEEVKTQLRRKVLIYLGLRTKDVFICMIYGSPFLENKELHSGL